MDREKTNPSFDINAKYEEMINVSKRIVEHHEFVSDGSCEPPMFVCLAYDVKNYLPKLLKENQKQKEIIDVLDFIKARSRQGATQETINKLAINFVNKYIKEAK